MPDDYSLLLQIIEFANMLLFDLVFILVLILVMLPIGNLATIGLCRHEAKLCGLL